jgi:N-acetylmuramoyl-L-alanine amidase/Putative peptidoglycan binding domain
LEIISRGAWGARPARHRQAAGWRQRRELILHATAPCTGGYAGQTPAQIQAVHMDRHGLADIGPNFLIDTGGRIYEGRGWSVIGSHAVDHDTIGIGVALIGADTDLTPAAQTALRDLHADACRLAGRRLLIRGHADLPGAATTCPGPYIQAWIAAGMPPPAQTCRPGSPAPPFPGRLLAYPPGTHGEDVQRWQAQMRRRGHPLTADGIYDADDATACQAFQTAAGLRADGIVDPITWRATWELPII